MARFASQAELETFLSRLDLEYSQITSILWQNGVRTARQLANATKPLLLSWGLPELYIDDIKATADRTGELNALNACTVYSIYHQAILQVVCLCTRHTCTLHSEHDIAEWHIPFEETNQPLN